MGRKEREREMKPIRDHQKKRQPKNGMKEREIDLSGPLPPARAKSLREFSP